MLAMLEGSNPYPAKKGETNMLKLSAAYAMLWELITVIVLCYFNATITQYIVVGVLVYGIAFFVSVLVFSLCQVAS
jgi:hypothetical protein